MTQETRDGHTVITAEEGMFLQQRNGSIYGLSISLGKNTQPDDFEELPIDQMPQEETEPLTENN